MIHKYIVIIIFLAYLPSSGHLSAQDQPPANTTLNLQTWPQLYIADVDGKNPKRLFPESTHRAEGSPSFSEGGQLMIFSGFNAEKKSVPHLPSFILWTWNPGKKQNFAKA